MRQQRRQDRFDLSSGHAGGQHGQRVTQINHPIELDAEEIVADQ